MDNTSVGTTVLIYFLFLWSLVWKGLALWKAAKQSQRNWFIVLLLPFGTAGILEIVYLFRFSKKRMTVAELKTWFKDTFFTKSK